MRVWIFARLLALDIDSGVGGDCVKSIDFSVFCNSPSLQRLSYNRRGATRDLEVDLSKARSGDTRAIGMSSLDADIEARSVKYIGIKV